ncbi:MAG: RbsD/FucU family protein [Oscillospiraceae bacterium]|jgi:L-fucose mutarotase|nr:RbsD/FucU family protein [Oscillospiraceae bacterium]
MLMHIPKIFTPDLLRLLMAMGHGETLLLADANYPAVQNARGGVPILYLPVEDISALLGDILRFYPLDAAVEQPCTVMQKATESGALAKYEALAGQGKIKSVERFAFYTCAQNAVGIVVTADTTPGANILIQKGVVK